MIRQPLLTGLLCLACLASPSIPACTLWGAAGDASAEGTLIVKNRDWAPNHQQSLRLTTPKTGYRYVGLFVDDGRFKGIKAGVNQPGLVVVSASASSLARAVREEDRERHGVMTQILQRFASLDEVAAHADEVFPTAKPVFLLLADKSGLMQVEVGQQGRYQLRLVAEGTTAHTNQYEDVALLDQPQQVGISSATRLARIQSLLAQGASPWRLADFTRISRDQNAGPDNSLWRHGKEYTLASWQMALPQQGPARLHLILANPGQPELSTDIALTPAFWRQADTLLLPAANP